MPATLLPNAETQFIDGNGKPLCGGSVYFYVPNTTTFKNTWQDAAQTILNTNPIILDGAGRAVIWGSGTYRQVVYDQNGNLVWDQITQGVSANLIGDFTDNIYQSTNGGFVPGTTTQLTLVSGPGSSANMWVFFDSAYQTPDTYTVSTNVVTFNAPIPVGVQEVVIKVGTTVAIGVPASGSVTDASVATGSALYNRINHLWDVTDPQFGAKGDGVTDDSAAINKALQLAANFGGEVYFPQTKTFLINSPLVCSTTVPLTPVLGTNYQLYFSDMRTVTIRSPGRSTIIAGASMTNMLNITFGSGNIAPYFCEIDGLVFNGNNLASNGLITNFSTKAHFARLSFVGMNGGYGLSNNGYGVAEYLYNTFATKIGISVQRGGDTVIEHNDFYAPMNSNGHIGIEMQGFSGNTHIHKNTFTADATSINEIPINLDANIPSQSGQEIRDVTIRDNEISGYDLPISGTAGSNNLYNCIVSGNHKTAFGTKVSAAFMSLTGPGQFIISDNIFGNAAYPTLTGNVLSFANASRMTICGNKFTNLQNTPIVFTNVVQSKVYDNEFYDVSKVGAGNATIFLGSTCTSNEFYRNTYNQSSASYGQIGIQEGFGADFNTATSETFIGVSNPYMIGGGSSHMVQTGYGTAAPGSGTHNAGDIVWNTGLSNSAGVPIGFVCVTSGTPGTWRSFGVTV